MGVIVTQDQLCSKYFKILQRDSLQVTVKFKFPTEIMLMIMKCRINDFY